MVKFGVAASDELKMIGRLLTYKYRHAQGLVSTEFADVVDLLNVSINGEAYNASHFPNADAVGLLDSRDPERKTVRLCYGTDPELFVIQVIDNLIKTDGNEPLRAWLNGLPGKNPRVNMLTERPLHVPGLPGPRRARGLSERPEVQVSDHLVQLCVQHVEIYFWNQPAEPPGWKNIFC